MAAIIDFNGSRKAGERNKFVPKGWLMVQNKERGAGG